MSAALCVCTLKCKWFNSFWPRRYNWPLWANFLQQILYPEAEIIPTDIQLYVNWSMSMKLQINKLKRIDRSQLLCFMGMFVWLWSNTLFLERALVCGINNGPFLQPYGYKLRFLCRKCEVAFQPSQAFAEQSRKSEVTSLALIYKFHALCGNKLHTILRRKSGDPLR